MERRRHPYQGLWISFESGEGAGKGTQIELLRDFLTEKGYTVIIGREPGHTESGEAIRNVLQNPDMPKLDEKTEMLLYVAAGIPFYEQAVKPALEKGDIFLADRWRDSTKAYQGYGLGISLEVIDILTKFSCGGSYPDLTFLLDVQPQIGLAHIKGNEFGSHTMDKIESRPLEYHERVNEGFRLIAQENLDRFRVIPYQEGNIDGMQTQIRNEVERYIREHSLADRLSKIY
jgi:dTMP kinase